MRERIRRSQPGASDLLRRNQNGIADPKRKTDWLESNNPVPTREGVLYVRALVELIIESTGIVVRKLVLLCLEICALVHLMSALFMGDGR